MDIILSLTGKSNNQKHHKTRMAIAAAMPAG
jgi:hypothetical protein